MSKRPKILVVCPYPLGTAPSQRFRIEPYFQHFRDAGFDIDAAPFMDQRMWEVLYKPGHTLQKVTGVLRGFLRQFAHCFRAAQADYILLHREACPIGPPFFESFLFSIGKQVIFDFDDAIFVNDANRRNPLLSWLRSTGKIQYFVRKSYRVAACNPYLVTWASQFNNDVRLIPTIIDPRRHRPLPKQHSGTTIIGWTGSHSTMCYLDIVRPALAKLQNDFEFEFRVICDVDPGFPDLHRYRFVPWRLETEIEDLNEFDIGVMPVPDGIWERGKVGFKAIQYSAMNIVPVASNVGSGPEVVESGQTGLLPDNNEESWVKALAYLLSNPASRAEMGARARARILQNYSVDAVAPKLIAMFR